MDNYMIYDPTTNTVGTLVLSRAHLDYEAYEEYHPYQLKQYKQLRRVAYALVSNAAVKKGNPDLKLILKPLDFLWIVPTRWNDRICDFTLYFNGSVSLYDFIMEEYCARSRKQ